MNQAPPHNKGAELALLGSIIINEDAIHDADSLTPDDFYFEYHGYVFKAFQSLARQGKPIDTLTTIAELKRLGHWNDKGGEVFIIGLISEVPTSMNAHHYAEIVRDMAQRRALIYAAGKVATAAHDLEAEAIQDTAMKAIMEAMRGDSTTVTLGRGAMNVLELLEAAQRGEYVRSLNLPWRSLGSLDIETGALVTVGARPGMGKTSFLLQAALNAAKTGKHVVFVSLEMPAVQLSRRLISFMSGIEHEKLKPTSRETPTDAEMSRIHTAVGELERLSFEIVECQQLADVETTVHRATMRHGRDVVVFVDYLQLLRVKGLGAGKEYSKVTEISQRLKRLAKSLDIWLISAVQLSRKVEDRQDKRPLLSDIRDSGSVEQDSDVVLFLYRDEYYNPETTESPGVAEVSVAKNRAGRGGYSVSLAWIGKRMMFGDLHRTGVVL
jgi:replicative DNA helicase